jgi:hypothetical protein
MKTTMTLKGESKNTKALSCGRFVGVLYIQDICYHSWLVLGEHSTDRIRQLWADGKACVLEVTLTSEVVHTASDGTLWVNTAPSVTEKVSTVCRHPELAF